MPRVPTGQGKAAVTAEAEVCSCGGGGSGLRGPSQDSCGNCLGVHWPCSPSFSPQSSQPSTTSPFKQEVFVYSPSPSSENPSLGAAATPIIMSRSPTGQWHEKMRMTELEGRNYALTAIQRACAPGVPNWPTSAFPRP